MRLYHGSNVEIENPCLSFSKPFKDFGKGFYLSDTYKQAEDMALLKVLQLKNGTKWVSEFDFDEQLFRSKDLNVKLFDDYSEEWAEFILANRDRLQQFPVHSFDVVVGPIADDGVAYQLRRYTSGIIPMNKLIEELKFSKGMTIQYFFGSEKALSFLKKV